MAKSCSICLEDIGDDVPQEYRTILSCDHEFHPACILKWFEHKTSCPTCRHEHVETRANAATSDPIVNLTLQYSALAPRPNSASDNMDREYNPFLQSLIRRNALNETLSSIEQSLETALEQPLSNELSTRPLFVRHIPRTPTDPTYHRGVRVGRPRTLLSMIAGTESLGF